jgi:VIT1/CCC1 family predicted Fe2+/Mn2+ transporter
MTSELQKEISSLEHQIDFQEKRLDIALKNDMQLGEAKKLVHELKMLKAKLSELNQQYSN